MREIFTLLVLCLGLCFPLLASAQASVTLLVRTDMSCNWKLDGQTMEPLRADASTIVLVTPGEHLIEAAATKGTATLRTNLKVEKSEKTVDLQFKGRSDHQVKMLPADPPKRQTAAEIAQNPIWTDAATGLMWTIKDNGSDVDWRKATAYCAKLQYAGYTGWRLPNNEELEGIKDLKVTAQKTFDDGVTRDVHVKGNLNLTGDVWSSTPGRDQGKPYEASWMFTFADASYTPNATFPLLNFTHYDSDMRALCVRVGATSAATGAAAP